MSKLESGRPDSTGARQLVATKGLLGGCLCGGIRYVIDDVFDVIYCHCHRCRKRSGAPVNCAMAIAGDAFHLTKGTPRAYVTSAEGISNFCERCGSPICWEGCVS